MSLTAVSMPRKPVFATDDERWAAILGRDANADGIFYYSVRTTGVYCRPSCGARRPRRENVDFYSTADAAERAGFRPCKRCRPRNQPVAQERAARIAEICRAIESTGKQPNLQKLAQSAGLSPYHFHRLFKSVTGVTPRAYFAARRAQRVRQELQRGSTVTNAIYEAGFNSNAPFYTASEGMLGMTPTKFRSGGSGMRIRFAVGECSLGSVLVAATEKGICSIMLSDDPNELVRELQDRFPNAELLGGDAEFEKSVAQVIGFIEAPGNGFNLPLDVRGTAFQQRVWQALRRIPAGTTTTYTELARSIGAPAAVRAVGSACGANPIAVAIPCHRVVRTDGALAGYRWGIERKRALLERESRS